MLESKLDTSIAALNSASTMFVFALVALLLIALINTFTEPAVTANQHNKLIGKLEAISNNNSNVNIDWQKLELTVFPIVLCDEKNQHLGWLDQLNADGYAGSIELLIGLNAKHTITGLAVLRHQETPGIGDVIETGKSNWMENFKGLGWVAANAPPWKLTSQDGEFEAITGATITTKAVLGSVQTALTNLPWLTTQLEENPCD